MPSITYKIAFPIILAGLFVVIIFAALNYSQLNLGFYIVICAIIVFLLFFAFSAAKSFSGPVRKLLERAISLANGDLSSRFYMESKDEFGDLARILNDIAQKFEESKTAAENAEQGIDIKVKARTEALEETITALEQKINNRTLELEKSLNEINTLKKEIPKKYA